MIDPTLFIGGFATKAVIIAAGRGTRLGVIGRRTPKTLLRVKGRFLLERQLDALKRVGVNEVIVVAGHLQEMISAFLASRPPDPPVRMVVNRDYAGTGGAFSFLLGSEGLQDDLLYLIGDMIYEPALAEKLAFAGGNRVSLAVQRRPTASEDMKVRLSGPLVAAVGKSIEPAMADGEFLGAARIPRGALEDLRGLFQRFLSLPGKRKAHFGDAAAWMIEQGMEIGWLDLSGFAWAEIDCALDLAEVRRKWERLDD